MTGKQISDFGFRISNLKSALLVSRPFTGAPKSGREHPVLNSQFAIRNSKWRTAGFTLLELMIVISIIIILASIVLAQYQKTILHARETVLREDLRQMRVSIDQYGADKGKLPQSLDDLVSAGYLREIPEDPITRKKDWNVVTGDDPNSTQGATGVTDVHSSSSDTSSGGKPYSEW